MLVAVVGEVKGDEGDCVTTVDRFVAWSVVLAASMGPKDLALVPLLALTAADPAEPPAPPGAGVGLPESGGLG